MGKDELQAKQFIRQGEREKEEQVRDYSSFHDVYCGETALFIALF